MNNKKLMKVVGLLAVVALLAAVLPVSPVKAAATLCVGPTTEGCYSTIQAAVGAAAPGDMIYIREGTYVEDISATVPLNFIGEVNEEGQPLPEIQGTLTVNLSSYTGAKNWRIENLKFTAASGDGLSLTSVGNLLVENSIFNGAIPSGSFLSGFVGIQATGTGNSLTVKNSTFIDGWYVSLQGYYAALDVRNSTFANVKSGINVQGAAGNTVTISNSDFSVIAQGVTNDTYGVRFASEGASTGGDLTITNSRFFVDKAGLTADAGTYHSAIIIRAGATGALKVDNSSILGEVVNLATPELDARFNWWGDTEGPGEGVVTGNVDYDPWLDLYIILDEDPFDLVDEESIFENEDPGTLLGDLEVDSGDDDNVFTFALVSDDETCPGPDNDKFQIEGNNLLSMESFNYEDADNPDHIYNICIGATDPWEHQVDQQFAIEVKDVNDAPVLTILPFDNVVDEHVEISFPVSATDEDVVPDPDTLTFDLIGEPEYAAVTHTNDGTEIVSWTPHEEQGPGEYTFTVQVCDNDNHNLPPAQHILCDEQEVTIIVNEVNAAPIAKPDFYLGSHEPTIVEAPGVLLNDEDVDFPENNLSVRLISDIPAGEGSLVLDSDGSFVYTPPIEWPTDFETEFTYQVYDGTVYSNVATVTIKFNDTWPADITLAPLTSQENTIYNGTLNTLGDSDSGDTWTYALVSGEGDADNDLFEIVFESPNFKVVSKDELNFEAQEVYSIRVRSTDIYGAWYERSFTIRVLDQNDAPVLAPIGNRTVNELEELTFTATATDEDVPADELTFSLSGAPTGAQIDPESGEFWWGPSEAQGRGIYTFDVCVSDNVVVDPVCETIVVTVYEVNQAPVLDPIGNKIINENATLTFTATANDADILPGGVHQTLYFTLSSAYPLNYGASIGANTGIFTWNPGENRGPGEYQFEITVRDGVYNFAEDSELITVTVNEVNQAPNAVDDEYLVIAGQTLSVSAPGVLSNDTDADLPNNTKTAILQDNVPAGEGELDLNPDGSFTYTPPDLPDGEDFETHFTYKVFDGTDYSSNIATVRLIIRYENSAPTDMALTPLNPDENAIYTGTLSSTDPDTLEAFVYTLVEGPGDYDNELFYIGGTGGNNLISNEKLNYEEKLSYNVRIRTTDLFGEWYEEAFIIAVQDVNDAPEAFDQSVTTLVDTPIAIELEGFDEDGDPLDFAIFTEPAHGAVSGNEVGRTMTTESGGILRLIGKDVTYTPVAGFAGEDSFTFKSRDPEGAVSNLATVTIIVNDIPEAMPDAFEGTEDTLLFVEAPGVLANDINDEEVATLTAVRVDPVSHGELSLSSNGSFTYMPEENFFGEDSFTYKACEGSLCSEPAEVTLTIAPINDAPVADDVVAETAEDTAVSITLDVSDVEGDDLVASIVTPPAHGVAVVSGTVVIYTPEADWNGLDEFTYKVNDGALDSNVAVISVNVTPVNDAPVANDMDVEALEDTPEEITLDVFDVDNPVEDLVVTILAGPSNGTVIVDGIVVTYTPTAGFSGEDAFSYKVSDGELESLVSTVRITVNPLPLIHFYLPLILK